VPKLEDELGSHRITLGDGFAVVYGKNLRPIASFQAPPESSQASLLPWLPEKDDSGTAAAAVTLHGPLSANLLEYWTLFRSRNSIRTTYFIMLLVITALVFFSSIWLAVFLSKQITRPVEALADAMDEIADGKLEQRVSVDSSGEMAELVRPSTTWRRIWRPAGTWRRVRASSFPRRIRRSRSGGASWRRFWRRFPAAW
jgi:two-component system nitrogen regulation sensor histidine kinase NtrY